MKDVFNISFSPPDMTDAEVFGALEAIKSGWITTGPKVKEFERKKERLVQAEKALDQKMQFFQNQLQMIEAEEQSVKQQLQSGIQRSFS